LRSRHNKYHNGASATHARYHASTGAKVIPIKQPLAKATSISIDLLVNLIRDLRHDRSIEIINYEF
jgi:hypothetical protein